MSELRGHLSQVLDDFGSGQQQAEEQIRGQFEVNVTDIGKKYST